MEERGINNRLQNIERPFDIEESWTAIRGHQKKKKRTSLWIIGVVGLLIITASLWQYSGLDNDDNSFYKFSSKSTPVLEEKQTTSTNFNFETPIKQKSFNNKYSIENQKLSTERTSSNLQKTLSSSSLENQETTLASFPSSMSRSRNSSKLELGNLPLNAPKIKDTTKPVIWMSSKGKKVAKQEIANLQDIANLNPIILFDRQPIPTKVITSISINSNHASWSISIFGGLGYIKKNLIQKQRNFESFHLNNRLESERVLESLSAGLEIKKRVVKKLSLGVGISTLQLSESFSYSESIINSFEDIDPADLPSDAIGQVGYLIKNSNAKFFNTYRFIDLNMKAYYHINLGLFQVNPFLGASYNLSVNTNAHLFDSFLEVRRGDTYFKRQIPIRYLAGANIDVQLSKQFILQFGFQYESIADISSTRNKIAQSYSTLNGNLGIGLQF